MSLAAVEPRRKKGLALGFAGYYGSLLFDQIAGFDSYRRWWDIPSWYRRYIWAQERDEAFARAEESGDWTEYETRF